MTAQSQVTTSNMSYQPIADMSFQGLHWIEASAGTGKTFTLSSLMVRIFLGPICRIRSLQPPSPVLPLRS